MQPPCRTALSARSGFTLVEVLVVILIVGILVVLLMPTVMRMQEVGSRAGCAAMLRSIGASLPLYCAENNGWMLTGFAKGPGNYWDWNHLNDNNWKNETDADGNPMSYRAEHSGWRGFANFMDETQGFVCPSSSRSAFPRKRTANSARPSSYSVIVGQPNAGWEKDGPTNVRMGNPAKPFKLGDPRVFPSKSGVLCDSLYVPESQGSKNKWGSHERPGAEPSGGNILFLDGHVEWRNYNQFYTANSGTGIRLALADPPPAPSPTPK